MYPNRPETIFVDADSVLDPKILKASGIIQTERRGLSTFTPVNVIADGARKAAVKISFLDAERGAVVEALQRAGLDILNIEICLGSRPAKKWK